MCALLPPMHHDLICEQVQERVQQIQLVFIAGVSD